MTIDTLVGNAFTFTIKGVAMNAQTPTAMGSFTIDGTGQGTLR